MAPKFALFTKGSKLPLNKGFKKYVRVTTALRSTLENSVRGYISYLGCHSLTLWNIFMKLHTNTKPAEMMCHYQERQHLTFWILQLSAHAMYGKGLQPLCGNLLWTGKLNSFHKFSEICKWMLLIVLGFNDTSTLADAIIITNAGTFQGNLAGQAGSFSFICISDINFLLNLSQTENGCSLSIFFFFFFFWSFYEMLQIQYIHTAPDEEYSDYFFLISPLNNMLWVLIWSALARHF